MAASLIVGGVLLLAMVVASGRAAVTLPAEARIPVHVGSVEHPPRALVFASSVAQTGRDGRYDSYGSRVCRFFSFSLPAARIPGTRSSSTATRYLVSKRAGLVIWPAVGAVLFGVVGGITRSSLAGDWVPGVRDVLTPAVMGVALAFQIGALVLARRGPAGMATASPDQAADG